MKRAHSETEVAWAAGFFDGEGWVGCNIRAGKHSPNAKPQLDMEIGQSDPASLRRFLRAVGYGKVYGPYAAHGLERKPTWRYALKTADVLLVYRMLRPHLCAIKRQQFRDAIKKYRGAK